MEEPSDARKNRCREEGLDCLNCVRSTAESTARVCDGRGACAALFTALYPDAECRPLKAQFERAYGSALARRARAAVA